MSAHLKNCYESTFPANNVYCHGKSVATDTIYYETPAINDGYTCTQLFLAKSHWFWVYMVQKKDKQLFNTLE